MILLTISIFINITFVYYRSLTTLKAFLTFALIGERSCTTLAVKGCRKFDFVFTRKSRVCPRAPTRISRTTMDNDRESNQHEDSKDSAFYTDGAKYWEQVPPTSITLANWIALDQVLMKLVFFFFS